MVPLISADKNLAIGFRYNNRFYFDFKSNFGWWGRDKPSNPSTANYYNTDISHVITMTDNNLIQSEAHIDKFDAVYVLNAGYNYPLVKSKKITISLFAGIGLALTREVIYDRYVNDYDWSSFQGTWWAEKRNPNTNVNINAGIELAFRNGGGILLGMDSYTSSLHVGYVIQQ